MAYLSRTWGNLSTRKLYVH